MAAGVNPRPTGYAFRLSASDLLIHRKWSPFPHWGRLRMNGHILLFGKRSPHPSRFTKLYGVSGKSKTYPNNIFINYLANLLTLSLYCAKILAIEHINLKGVPYYDSKTYKP